MTQSNPIGIVYKTSDYSSEKRVSRAEATRGSLSARQITVFIKRRLGGSGVGGGLKNAGRLKRTSKQQQR